MKENMQMEETLWNYIDGSLAGEQASRVEQLLQSDEAWKSKYRELLDVHTLMLEHTPVDQPSLRFTQNVMEEISRLYITPAAASYINRNVIRGIGLFFLLSIGGLLVYGIGQMKWSGTGSTDRFNLDKVVWSKFYNSTYTNIFMMANILLALMLVDMYLTHRKKQRAATP